MHRSKQPPFVSLTVSSPRRKVVVGRGLAIGCTRRCASLEPLTTLRDLHNRS
jgi:hypothetical protein